MTRVFTIATGAALLLSLTSLTSRVWAQGCVAVRHSPTAPLLSGSCANCTLMAHQWLASFSYRWLYSDRDFSGDRAQPAVDAADPVANEIHSFDLSVAYGITDRWSATLSLPFSYAERTTKYEHDLIQERTMRAGGLGDLRLLSSYWLLDPHEYMDGNIALGLGFKAPTGDAAAKDISYRGADQVRRPVDQSIQPGDGGWGILVDLQAYHEIYENLFGYFSGSYMITPQEQNNTEVPYADFFEVHSALQRNSIADQYLGRAGLSYVAWPEQGLTFSLGVRNEGVPVHDLIGGSLGFRRPGYAVSIEPGVAWAREGNALSLSIPAAVYRNRERSAGEAHASLPTGHATFADVVILFSFNHRF